MPVRWFQNELSYDLVCGLIYSYDFDICDRLCANLGETPVKHFCQVSGNSRRIKKIFQEVQFHSVQKNSEMKTIVHYHSSVHYVMIYDHHNSLISLLNKRLDI